MLSFTVFFFTTILVVSVCFTGAAIVLEKGKRRERKKKQVGTSCRETFGEHKRIYIECRFGNAARLSSCLCGEGGGDVRVAFFFFFSSFGSDLLPLLFMHTHVTKH